MVQAVKDRYLGIAVADFVQQVEVAPAVGTCSFGELTTNSGPANLESNERLPAPSRPSPSSRDERVGG
jgi:hypothetical protein